jgi:hypothetical protein
MSFTDTRLKTNKTVNGTIVQGVVALTSSTTSGTIKHGLAMVNSVNLQLLSASSTGYLPYVSQTPPTSADLVVIATTGMTLSYMISGY